jgi:bifunctional non-homologous end joining protein LigD
MDDGGAETMPLEEYARKRKFSDTPEPPPSPQGKSKLSAKGPYFCVQRHDATRLHYDFRLEVDGVLKSWAVPKGPTLDPTLKHLAAHVEDHPLDYGGFEGNIPAGNYGAGSVMLWDRGSWELLDATVPAEQQLERGDFKFRLHGEKLNGDFALVRMKNRGKGNEWLIIKKRDDFAVPGWNTEEFAWSVLSGRSQEEIAQGMPARKGKRKSAGNPERVWKSRPARGAAAAAVSTPAPVPRKKKLRTLTPPA